MILQVVITSYSIFFVTTLNLWTLKDHKIAGCILKFPQIATIGRLIFEETEFDNCQKFTIFQGLIFASS